MMKLVVVLALVAVTLARPDGDHYPEKFDNFDVKEIIENIRLLTSYTHCFIGEGKCTAEGKEIRDMIPEAVQTTCAKCTDKQKHLVAIMIEAIQEKLPEEYEKLLKSVDPEGKHRDQLKAFLEKYGKKE